MNIPYAECKELINEGDVLLFRGAGIVSFFIKQAGVGAYTHVGLASWATDDILECVEFREWKGGRSINMDYYAATMPGQIDVYRPVPFFSELKFNPVTYETTYIRIPFKGREVTNELRKLTGLPYGWRRILWIALFKMPILRYFAPISLISDDTVKDLIYPVCSTTTSYCFSKRNLDLIKNRSDEWTEPSDIAKSARLNYLFTIV